MIFAKRSAFDSSSSFFCLSLSGLDLGRPGPLLSSRGLGLPGPFRRASTSACWGRPCPACAWPCSGRPCPSTCVASRRPCRPSASCRRRPCPWACLVSLGFVGSWSLGLPGSLPSSFGLFVSLVVLGLAAGRVLVVFALRLRHRVRVRLGLRLGIRVRLGLRGRGRAGVLLVAVLVLGLARLVRVRGLLGVPGLVRVLGLARSVFVLRLARAPPWACPCPGSSSSACSGRLRAGAPRSASCPGPCPCPASGGRNRGGPSGAWSGLPAGASLSPLGVGLLAAGPVRPLVVACASLLLAALTELRRHPFKRRPTFETYLPMPLSSDS